jgi:hypothetical protein
MRNVRVTLAAGIALMAVVGAVALTRSPPRVLRAVSQGERVGPGERVGFDLITGDAAVCQADEVLPAGVSGIRLWMRAIYGARVYLVAYSGSRVLTEGRRGPEWTGQTVTVPVTPVGRASTGVKLCFAIGPNSEPVVLLGDFASAQEPPAVARSGLFASPAAASEGRPLAGRVGVEYLAAGRGSWWSRVLSVARNMGFGRAFSGSWIALLVAVLMAAVGALAVRLTVRELP